MFLFLFLLVWDSVIEKGDDVFCNPRVVKVDMTCRHDKMSRQWDTTYQVRSSFKAYEGHPDVWVNISKKQNKKLWIGSFWPPGTLKKVRLPASSRLLKPRERAKMLSQCISEIRPQYLNCQILTNEIFDVKLWFSKRYDRLTLARGIELKMTVDESTLRFKNKTWNGQKLCQGFTWTMVYISG